MECRKVRPLLAAYLDGQVEEGQRAQIKTHLGACADCTARLADYERLGREIRALPRLAPPVALHAAVMAQVAQERRGWWRWGGNLTRAGSGLLFVMALIVLVLGLASLLRGFQDDGVSPVVRSTSPPAGATGISARSRLEITFDRLMDRESVLGAIQVRPEAELAAAWQAETLTLLPLHEWASNTTYTLTIGVEARDARGRHLAQPFTLTFATAGMGGSLNPVGRFGHVWRAAFDGPGGGLGYAIAPAYDTWSAWQPLERGLMFWQDNVDDDLIFVLFYGPDHDGGTWERFVDTWREGDPEGADYTPPDDLLEPIRGFGRIWRDALGDGADGNDAVGWAIVPEQGFVGTWQSCENGLMLWNPIDAQVYVFVNDGTWARFPDPWSP